MAVSRLVSCCYAGMANGFRSVGDVFLKNVYFSHNADRDEISLAELV